MDKEITATWHDLDIAIQQSNLEFIKNSKVYQQMMADSFGGILYNEANRNKYDKRYILGLWDTLSPSVKESADGIVKGAINFLKGDA